jgi:hypothetical protein
MTDKESPAMTKPNNSEPLKSHRDFRNIFLLALHVVVLAVSLWIHPISFTSADRALPYAMYRFF